MDFPDPLVPPEIRERPDLLELSDPPAPAEALYVLKVFGSGRWGVEPFGCSPLTPLIASAVSQGERGEAGPPGPAGFAGPPVRHCFKTAPPKKVLKQQRKIIFFKTSLLQLCRDRVLMDSLVPRERLEITVQREMLDPPDLLDPLVPLDLRFVRA